MPLFPGRNVQDQLEKIFLVLGPPNQERHATLTKLEEYGQYRFEEKDPQPLGAIVNRLDGAGLDLLQVRIGI